MTGQFMNIKKLAYQWIVDDADKTDVKSSYYCQTRDIFQARLNSMRLTLLNNKIRSEENIYIITAVAGEIGNNSFDHNLGNWPDIMGIFFGYETNNQRLEIVLADRGQGVLKTLKNAKPELKTDIEALKTAFTEKISGRAPENRGNGLKFVKNNIKIIKANLNFVSGNAEAKLNNEMTIKQIDQNIQGCLVEIKIKK
ncbi:hypothetical protein KKC56_01570 [Patescibacteria group bacterium]|nr:hypothetical protein [Patescibacteria group bacterium]MBU1160248.1 hypothetical protein [Patescibacteria group bacterium]MBU1349508.1 hypothetical protein [Patescibacteria group bacterium]MBU1421091.1 hypothetical protein [Patescibacteria group bacterium]MBU1684133.1 hypothetical protein [Patescibacteria group bacterium]